MGAVKVDTQKQARAYEVKYCLNDSAGVKALLRDRHRIAERRYSGDTAACDIIIDLHSAIESAGLTERQAEAIAWVYGRDLTQKVAAGIMGVAQQNVAAAIDRAAEAIASVYARWEYGEITVEYTEDNEMEAA
ncbi:RNA polymerase subunit sigma [Paenibacillus chibensis]|uniref:RNA polymerase subunit sigma n=1 Tax=Paenibacillus chibensis TaxID=59846 RepID=UPI000FDAAD73|nr:RNA polymerase subunit sigma [Paenibacillus chibensis]MEC0370028.1 RNA polymerase subunit sigma [Paenibacillus chibensis]